MATLPKLAIVGATGLVGQTICQILPEGSYEILPVASPRSVGKCLYYAGRSYMIIGLEEAVQKFPKFAIFSAGSSISKEWAPIFTAAGTTVIDNSSAWRMDPACPLVVPEVNAHMIPNGPGNIIANPNCSVIQLVIALAPLQRHYGLRRVIVSSYQAVSGSGRKAIAQMENERKNKNVPKEQLAYPHPIDLNLFPHIDAFTSDGYTVEEHKVINETRKILALPNLSITATNVRVPVHTGHGLSVNVELSNDFVMNELIEVLECAPGLVVAKTPEAYHTPQQVQGSDQVWVSRLRRDYSRQGTLNLWIVADNLRKGAATNAIQIMESIRF